MELVVNLLTIKQGDFTSNNNAVKSKALEDNFATSDSVHHAYRCLEILGIMTIAATEEGANFKLK